MTKEGYLDIMCGVICSFIIWILSIVLSGEVLGGDILKLGYSHLGLGKIYFIVFLAYNIGMAIYAKKEHREALFTGAYITIIVPVMCYFMTFLSYFIGTGDNIIETVLYVLGIPAATAIYIYDESVIMTILSGAVICLSPILSIIIYKCIRSDNEKM